MKVSDYIVSFLEEKKVEDVFLLAGGGFMHILDSLAKSNKINKYFNHHEQASGFSADGYSIYSGKTGVCIVTTGPGGTNTVTAVASSFIDSTPVVYISGQVKTADISNIPGVRQTGAQEADVISIVKSITKYAITVNKEEEIKYHLEKAFFIAEHERPGPVWVEVPLDIQSKDIDINKVKGFNPKDEGYITPVNNIETDIANIFELLKKAKRPVIMAGSGIRLSHAEELFIQLVKKLNIPVVSSRRMKDLLRNNDEYYFGCVGALPNRFSNYILQNSDFMLSIGSGLRYYCTAYNDSNFAPNANRVIVNIHKPELDKLKMEGAIKICADAKYFIESMLAYKDYEQPVNITEWFTYCNNLKNKYPTKDEYKPSNTNNVNPYMISHYIGEYMGDSDVLVVSPSAFAYTFCIPRIRKNQRLISHIGLGAMGTALPEAIGACVASGKRTIVTEGDGSLQLNLQELGLLRQYNLPIKLFVDVNNSYRQIYTMQNAHFKGRLAGCTQDSGISFPDFEMLANAYRIKYIKIDNNKNTEEIIKEIFKDNEPALIEMQTTMDMEYLPVIKSKLSADGIIQTPSLELLFPFLPDEEHNENMKISKELNH